MSTKPPAGRAPVWTPFFRRFVNERSVDLQETMRLHGEVTAAWRSSMWSDPHMLEAVVSHTFNKLHEWTPIAADFREPIKKIIREILEDERVLFSSPSGERIEELSLREQVTLRQFLRAQRDLIRDEETTCQLLSGTLFTAMAAITTALPKQTQAGIPLLTLPVLDVLTVKPGDVIERIMAALFNDDEVNTSSLFVKLREKLYINACRVTGIQPFEDTRKELIPASDADMPGPELIESYLGGTPFANIFEKVIPFQIERERFNEHGAIFARTGHGKTQALRSFVAQFLQEEDPPALFLIDSLGALIDGIDRLEVFNTTLRDRLVILDPSRPQYMPRLNFFNLQSDDLCFYLFKAIDQSFTPRQATMISYLMEYMRHVPQPDILKLVELCESKTNKYPEILSRLSPFAQSFFENQFFAGKGGDPFVAQTKAQIAQRLYTLGRLSKFNEIFSATNDVFDPYEHMQRKSIVLINTDARPPRAGGLGEGSAIFGRYILAQCLEAARMRPKRERHLALLIVDEFKAYADEMTGLILSDARQFGMGMLIASQQPHQLPEGVRREINTNTSIRFMGNIEYSIAAQYARDMFCEPEFILGMKKYDRSHAEWAAYVSGMDHAVKVDMPYGAIERMPKARESLRIMTSANVTPAQKLTPPQLYEDGYLDWMHSEMERAEVAGDWPKDDEKVPDGERAKDNEVPEGVIKPGKSWD